MVRLNDYTNEDLQTLYDRYTQNLAKSEAQLPSATGPAHRNTALDFLRGEAFTLGLLAYARAREPSEVWRFFEKALWACKEMFQVGADPSVNNPVALLYGIHVALILSSRRDAVELAKIRRYPTTRHKEGSFVADEVVMGYIGALMALIREERKEALEIGRLNVERCAVRKEGFARQFGAQTRMLVSVMEGQHQEFKNCLSELIQWHKNQAQKGRLRENPEGLMCVSGLALAQLGRDAGFAVDLESPYLPLSLLRG